MDVVESYRVEKPASQPYPLRVTEVDWADGPTVYYSGNDNQLLNHARDGGMPYFERDVSVRTIPDDGSEEWEKLAREVAQQPVRADAPRF